MTTHSMKTHLAFCCTTLLIATAPSWSQAGGAGAGADANSDPNIPQERLMNAKIESVLLYQGRAAITRTEIVQLTPGVWKLRFDSLPPTIQPDTLEAKSSAGRILSVDFSSRPVVNASATPEAIALDGEIRTWNQAIASTADQQAGLQSELRVVESVGVRASTDATKDGGTPKLDLPALDAQLTWMAAQRTRISAQLRTATERGDALRKELAATQARRDALGNNSKTIQSAEVLLAMTTDESVNLRLSYLVTDARWEPVYALRASPDRKTVGIEFDALVIQSSGEDWQGVRLSLSTAKPSRAANPSAVAPWFVHVVGPTVRTREVPASSDARIAYSIAAAPSDDKTGAPPEESDSPSDAGLMEKRKSLAQSLSEDAVFGGTGPSVTYTIALPFDASSDSQVRRRARIAAFDASAKFVYQIQPVASDGAFLRATLQNTSPFQLLPGRASVFVNSDYVGSAPFLGATPNGEFEAFFGADPAITVRRERVKQEDRQSGLFGGGLDTFSDYRTTILNGTGRAIDIELLDRRPVSMTDQVEVSVPTMSTPLSTDPQFVSTKLPQGILRWDLSLSPTPPGSEGSIIRWTVLVSRSKDIELSPLPRE
ncbi:MAG: mucoidy inhibitor MuiA family protein [Phycisphaerales bacterium]|nr:mucoidy inhibitor MuiA family protein [Phycisphaerales bacterium]